MYESNEQLTGGTFLIENVEDNGRSISLPSL